jgi:quercetin dioxygenase-like cupin family protein
MNQKTICQYVLAAGISLVFFSCKQKEKNTDSSTTDTTATSGTDTTQASTQPAVMDAVTAAPNFYKVAKDSLGLRVLEVSYKPGDSSALHSHPDYVVYAKDAALATFYNKDGAGMESPMKAGALNTRPAEVHSVKNTGKMPINVIVIEVNRPNTTVAQDAATDATKVSGNLYKLVKDTMGIRSIEINYKPGQSSAMHSHPDNVLYVIEGSTAEFTDKDGKKTTAELKKGMILVRGAEAHSAKNIGKTTLRAIMVEVNRPRN